MNSIKPKNFDSSFLYGKGEYGKKMYEFIIRAERVDKSLPGFEDIRYTIKKNQYTACLSSLLDKQTIVLMMSQQPLPRALKVFAAKDVKEDKATKVFIDVSEIVEFKNDTYILKNRDIGIFISYLVGALSTLIYYVDPSYLVNNATLNQTGTNAFAKLSANIIDYMRIGGVDDVRNKVLYMSAIYYQCCLLGKGDSDVGRQKALKISGLSARDADLIDVQAPLASYENISTFVDSIAKVIKVDTLKLDNYIDKWIFLYGSGTQFATELYTSFSIMLTNAYVGAYINNQKQIEKFVGRDLVDYTNTLFKVGSELL